MVVAPTPGQDRPAPERVRAQRAAAREALAGRRRSPAVRTSPSKTSERGRPGPRLGMALDDQPRPVVRRRRGAGGRPAGRGPRARGAAPARARGTRRRPGGRRLLGEGDDSLDATGFTALDLEGGRAEGRRRPARSEAGAPDRCRRPPHLGRIRRPAGPCSTRLGSHMISLCVREASDPPGVVWHLPALEPGEREVAARAHGPGARGTWMPLGARARSRASRRAWRRAPATPRPCRWPRSDPRRGRRARGAAHRGALLSTHRPRPGGSGRACRSRGAWR